VVTVSQPPVADVLSSDTEESNDDDGDASYLSSGTSSYESDHNNQRKAMVPKVVTVAVEEEIKNDANSNALVDKQLMEMMDEFEEPSVNSYVKFKTQHEIDPEQIEKYAPPRPELDDLDEIVEFGTVSNFIDDGYFQSIIMIRPHNP
jgi:hypothetical protein